MVVSRIETRKIVAPNESVYSAVRFDRVLALTWMTIDTPRQISARQRVWMERYQMKFLIWILAGPAQQAIGVFLFSLAIAVISPSSAILPALLAMVAFTLASPILIAGKPGYGGNFAIYIASWLLLFAIVPGMIGSELQRRHESGEALAVFMLPAILFPVAIVLSLIFYLVQRSGSRAGSESNQPGSPDASTLSGDAVKNADEQAATRGDSPRNTDSPR